MYPDQPGRLRQWTPCVAMLLLSLLSYLDRSVLAILSPTILADLHMSAEQYGYAIAAFSYCYMVANPLWGIAMDRRGLWVTAVIAVAVWSVASGAHALMTGMVGMCAARGVLGFGEGATFPAGLRTVAETLPPERRSFALGLAYSGGSLGAMLAPLLVTPVALRFGWRPTFALTALLGLLWIALWLGLRAAGVYVLKKPGLMQTASRRWNRNLVATVLLYGLAGSPLAFGLYAAPLYLSRVLHVSQAELGHLLWVPPAGWEAGYLFWGRAADLRRKRAAGRPDAYLIALAFAGFLVLLEPWAAHVPHPVLATMTLFFLLMFIVGGFVVFTLSDGLAVQSAANAGFLAGISISGWAAVTGALTPVLGRLFDKHDYVHGFWLIAALPTLGTLLWFAVRTRELPASTEEVAQHRTGFLSE